VRNEIFLISFLGGPLYLSLSASAPKSGTTVSLRFNVNSQLRGALHIADTAMRLVQKASRN